jgi:ketosteroid isomerase-like protein
MRRETAPANFTTSRGILSDYAPGAVLLTPDGPLKGADAMRPLFQALIAEFGKTWRGVQHEAAVRRGEYAYILWTAETADNMYEMATDTFVVRDGKPPTRQQRNAGRWPY